METKPSKVEKMKVKEIKIVKLQSGVWWRKGEGKRGKNIIKLEYISLFLLLYLIKCGVKWVPNKKYVCSIFFLLLSSVYVYWVLTNPIFRRSGLKFIIFSSTLNRFTYRLFFRSTEMIFSHFSFFSLQENVRTRGEKSWRKHEEKE